MSTSSIVARHHVRAELPRSLPTKRYETVVDLKRALLTEGPQGERFLDHFGLLELFRFSLLNQAMRQFILDTYEPQVVDLTVFPLRNIRFVGATPTPSGPQWIRRILRGASKVITRIRQAKYDPIDDKVIEFLKEGSPHCVAIWIQGGIVTSADADTIHGIYRNSLTGRFPNLRTFQYGTWPGRWILASIHPPHWKTPNLEYWIEDGRFPRMEDDLEESCSVRKTLRFRDGIMSTAARVRERQDRELTAMGVLVDKELAPGLIVSREDTARVTRLLPLHCESLSELTTLLSAAAKSLKSRAFGSVGYEGYSFVRMPRSYVCRHSSYAKTPKEFWGQLLGCMTDIFPEDHIKALSDKASRIVPEYGFSAFNMRLLAPLFRCLWRLAQVAIPPPHATVYEWDHARGAPVDLLDTTGQFTRMGRLLVSEDTTFIKCEEAADRRDWQVKEMLNWNDMYKKEAVWATYEGWCQQIPISASLHRAVGLAKVLAFVILPDGEDEWIALEKIIVGLRIDWIAVRYPLLNVQDILQLYATGWKAQQRYGFSIKIGLRYLDYWPATVLERVKEMALGEYNRYGISVLGMVAMVKNNPQYKPLVLRTDPFIKSYITDYMNKVPNPIYDYSVAQLFLKPTIGVPTVHWWERFATWREIFEDLQWAPYALTPDKKITAWSARHLTLYPKGYYDRKLPKFNPDIEEYVESIKDKGVWP